MVICRASFAYFWLTLTITNRRTIKKKITSIRHKNAVNKEASIMEKIGEVQILKCKNCGTQLAKDEQFCHFCGQLITKLEEN